jgi:hypothetical protein
MLSRGRLRAPRKMSWADSRRSDAGEVVETVIGAVIVVCMRCQKFKGNILFKNRQSNIFSVFRLRNPQAVVNPDKLD